MSTTEDVLSVLIEEQFNEEMTPLNCNEAREVIVATLEVPDSKKTALWTEFLVNGVKTKVILDTGAAVSLITKATLKKVNAEIRRPSNLEIITADGHSARPLGISETIRIKIGPIVSDVMFQVVERAGYELLLGMDWLTRVGMNLDLKKNVAHFYSGKREKVWPIHWVGRAENPIPYLREETSINEMEEYEEVQQDNAETFSAVEEQRFEDMIGFKLEEGVLEDRGVVQDVKIGPLPPEQERSVRELLNEFEDLFANDLSQLGKCKVGEHRIETQDAPPIKSRAYRRSPDEREFIDDEVEKMMKYGIVRKSTSPWSSPVVLVLKKDGSKRFCVDYRKINKITKIDAYPLPLIDEIFDALGGAQYFSSIDAASGFWQIPMSQRDTEKTAFVTHSGIYEFTVMPFGLCNAPATYQRIMDEVLRGLLWRKTVNFIDDALIYSKTFTDHLSDLREVLERYRRNNLKLSAKKCHIFCQKISFLGHIISNQGVEVDPAKVEKLRKMPEPHSTKDVRAFLGLASYYRRFIQGFSKIARPLTEMTKKDAIPWNPQAREAFYKLKKTLAEAPILSLPNFEEIFILTTDASHQGLGAMLSQNLDKKGEQAVAYASCSLTKAQKNYSITELEALAIVWGVAKFRVYLQNKPFTLRTDHEALKYLFNGTSEPSGRLARWIIALQAYKFNIEYVPGKTNPTDVLSRLVATTSASPSNGYLEEIEAFLKNGTLPENRKIRTKIIHLAKKFRLQEEQMQHRNKLGFWRLVIKDIPQRQEIISNVHNLGHFGVGKTVQAISSRYWWPNLAKETAKMINECSNCQLYSTPNHEETLRPIKVEEVFERWSLDYVGPLPETFCGYKFIIVATEHFTRWAEARATKFNNAQETADFLYDSIISRFGCPKHLQSDRGTSFLNEVVKTLVAKWKTKHHYSSPYHPQSNGMVERFNGTLCRSLKRLCQGKEWNRFIDQVLWAYRSLKHSATGESPAYLLYGVELRLPIDNKHQEALKSRKRITIQDLEKRHEQLSRFLPEVRKQALNRSKKAQDKRVGKSKSDTPFKIGDKVLRHCSWLDNSLSGKLEPKWDGPFFIHEVGDLGAYKLRTVDGKVLKNPVNGSRLREIHEVTVEV